MERKILAVILLTLLFTSMLILAFKIPIAKASGEVYYSVEPVAIAPLTDINMSANGLETPPTPSPIGENFTVEIHLTNATVDNVPNGVVEVEVHFDFSQILTYAVPTGFTDMLGNSGGVLTGPQQLILYAISSGFYMADGVTKVASPPYTGADQYIVGAASPTGVWNGADGLVAAITFQITGQPSSPPLSDFYVPLQTAYAGLWDANTNEIPTFVIQGSLHIDAGAGSLPYYSIEPVVVSPLMDMNESVNGLETPPTPSPVGQNFTVEIHLRNADGIFGVEVHFYFGNILTYAVPTGFTDCLGQAGGVFDGSQVLNAFTPGFYGANGFFGDEISTPPYTGAVYYEVAAISFPLNGWYGVDGLVAKINFTIIKQPQSSNGEPAAYLNLLNDFTDLVGFEPTPGNMEVPHDNVPGSLTINNDAPRKTSQGAGFIYHIYVNVTNDPYSFLTFNVTAYANSTFVASENVTLPSGNSTIVELYWNTVGFAYGNYSLTVNIVAWEPNGSNPVSNSTDIYAWVMLTIPGSVNGDFQVSLVDLVMLANAYGSHTANYDYQGEPASLKWNPNCDINGDGIVGLVDLVIMANHYNQHYP